MNYSLTYSGVILMLLGWLVKALNLNVGTQDLQTVSNFVLVVGGALVALYGRYKAGGVTLFGVKL